MLTLTLCIIFGEGVKILEKGDDEMKYWKTLKDELKKYRIVCWIYTLFYGLLNGGGVKEERIEDSEYARQNNEYVNESDLNNLDLFLRIDIETVNRCNGTCSFCPVNAKEKQRPYAKMSEELFKKIIDELHDLNYSKELALFDNNEPFLDERIVEFQKYVRESLPNAFLDLWTNGSLLTLDKFLEIIPYLDRIVIDNYNDELYLNPNVKAISDYIEDKPELKDKVVIYMRKQNDVLTSRGGLSPNKKDGDYYIDVKCVLPFQQFNVRPDGKISLCCNDALGVYTLGDLNKQSIKEIWYSNEYMKIRKEMKENGRKNLKLCSNCDTIGGDFD